MEKPEDIYGFFKGFFKQISTDKFGLIVILHTFGKDLKFHPHLHTITTADVESSKRFSPLWRGILLRNFNLRSNEYYYGYYTWSDGRKLYLKQIGRYTARYVRHPAISNSRIISISKNMTKFTVSNHIISKPTMEFITLLIQHIPPRHFRTIRHYGIYERKSRRNF